MMLSTNDSQTASADDVRALPPWPAQILDGLTVFFAAIALWVAVFGPGTVEVFGVDVALRSLKNQSFKTLILFFVRYLFWRRPTFFAHAAARYQQLRGAVRHHAPAVADALPWFLVTRVMVWTCGLIAVVTFGYPNGNPPFRWHPDELLNLHGRWDAGWYVGIIVRGYQFASSSLSGSQHNPVFFPAYPMAVRLAGLGLLGRDSHVAASWLGAVLSCVFLLIALVYVHRITCRFGRPRDAVTAIALLVSYPFAIYFSVPYTESLYLLAAAAACSYALEERWLAAAPFAALCGLTRPNGVLLALPLGVIALEHVWRARRHGDDTAAALGRALPAALPIGLTLSGVIVMTLLCWHYAKLPLLWMELQHTGWGRSADEALKIGGVLDAVRLFGIVAMLQYKTYEFFHLLALVAGVASIWPVARRLGPGLASFVAINLLVPAVWGGLLSMARFSSVLFPSFIWLALALPRRWRWPTVAVFAMGEALVAALFFTWRPIF